MFDTGFFASGGGGGGGWISGQDIGICIVCFGLLVVFLFWCFDIVSTHTKNYTKADIESVFGLHNCESESFKEREGGVNFKIK